MHSHHLAAYRHQLFVVAQFARTQAAAIEDGRVRQRTVARMCVHRQVVQSRDGATLDRATDCDEFVRGPREITTTVGQERCEL